MSDTMQLIANITKWVVPILTSFASLVVIVRAILHGTKAAWASNEEIKKQELKNLLITILILGIILSIGTLVTVYRNEIIHIFGAS